jgi:tetratricopeptide (TPR) repeat protein
MPLDRTKTALNADKFVRSGKIVEAIAEYKKLIEDNPRDMNVINKMGDLCVRAGKTQDAIRYFLRIAEFYSSDGFFLKAIAMYKKVSKLDPANMDCYQKLAGLYQQQGLTIEAKAQYMAVADHFIKASQFKRAIEVLPHVLEIEPDNIKVRMTLADLLARTGGTAAAAREFCTIARELAKKGMFDEALKVTQKGMKVAPGNADLMSLTLSLSKEAQKSPGDLLSSVVEMARANGDNPRSQALLAEAYLSAGKSAEAEKVFRRLQALGEGAPPEVAVALGRFHLAKGEEDQALDRLARAADQYQEEGRPSEAAGLLEEFLRAFPDSRGGLTKRASLAELAGDRKSQVEALAALAQVLIGVSETGAASEILERLKELEPENDRHAQMLASLKAKPVAAPPRAAPPRAAPTRPSVPRPAPVPDIQEGALDLEQGEELEEPAVEELSGGEEVYGTESKIQDMQEGDEGEEPDDDDFISEHFTEAEVFVKYGLLEKAKEQLLKILTKHPRHVPSHAKLKEIYYDEGDKAKAVDECLTLAGILKARGRGEEARELFNEAIRIDPNNPRVKQQASGTPPVPAPAAAPAARAAKPAPAPPPTASKPRPAAPPAPPPRAARPAPAAPPELEIEEVGGPPELEIEVEEPGRATGMEIEIDLAEEPPAPAPAPRPAAKPSPAKPATSKPAPSKPAAAAKARPEKIEEETPDDLAGLSFGDDGDEEITIDMAGDQPAPGSGRAAAVASHDPDPEKLGEVDFYIDQGLLEEARAVLFQLQKQFPESQEVAQRFERANRPAEARPAAAAPAAPSEIAEGLDLDVERAFGSQTMKITPPKAAATAAPRGTKATPVFRVETTRAEPEGEFFDLAGELDRSLAEAQVAVDTHEKEPLEGQGHSLEEIFKAFKKGVEQQVDSEDYDTHYNLGIAYKEMGLVDEAIGEFQYAAKDPARTVECCGILGLCFREKGMPQLALKWYQRGLDTPELGDQEAVGLRYDIAEVHREQGDYRKAMELYTEVFGMDSTYRDVAAKIKEMRKLLG